MRKTVGHKCYHYTSILLFNKFPNHLRNANSRSKLVVNKIKQWLKSITIYRSINQLH